MKKHPLSWLILPALLLALFATPAFANALSASAPQTSSSFVDPTSFTKTCAVTVIHLDMGKTPAMTCLRARLQAPVVMNPAITQGSCSTSNTVRVFANNFTTLVCFSGTGYTGTSITNVNEADSVANSLFVWVRVYHPLGKFCTFDPNNPAHFANGSNSGYTITQVNANSKQGGQCGPF
ncbi:MAG TPA: hypothetical protein VKX46_21310 [Ktedonobacteraceae bacterium]|jgi:hypothetical protein|nr:hypothetical protein [Ktedonobacteraceae bacterium]